MSTTLPPLEPDRRFVCPSGSRSPRRARGRTRSRLGLRSSVPLLRGRPDVYTISVSSRRRCERADSVETRLDPCGAVRHVEVLPALVVGEASDDALAGESPELIDRQEMQGDRPVAARGGQEPAVGTERHRIDDEVMVEQREALSPGRKIPELGGAIDAAGSDERSVWAHSDAQDRTAVPPERRELPARLQVPDLRRPVPAGRDHRSVGPERDVLDGVGMAAELPHPLEAVGVPNGQGVVTIVVGYQPSTVGAEGEGEDLALGVDWVEFLAREGIPQYDGPIPAA